MQKTVLAIRSLLGAFTAAGLLLSSGLVDLPARAASCSGDQITKTWRTPKTSTLGVSKQKKVDLIVATRKSCGVKHVKATVGTKLFDDKFSLMKYATEDGRDYWGATLIISPDSVYNDEAGEWTLKYALDGDSPDRTEKGPGFRIRRAAKLTANATPEPVSKGKKVTVTGTLKRANWESGKYRGFAEQKVELQFRATGGTYKKVKTIRSDDSGAVKTSTKASRSGCYRYVFDATSTTASVKASADCVRVRS